MSKTRGEVPPVRPCHEQAEASRECMEQAGGVKSKCQAYFIAYNDCKKELYERKREERNRVFFGTEK